MSSPDGTIKTVNKAFDKISGARKKIESEDDRARDVYRSLLEHPDNHVKYWAAALHYRFDNSTSKFALEKIAQSSPVGSTKILVSLDLFNIKDHEKNHKS